MPVSWVDCTYQFFARRLRVCVHANGVAFLPGFCSGRHIGGQVLFLPSLCVFDSTFTARAMYLPLATAPQRAEFLCGQKLFAVATSVVGAAPHHFSGWACVAASETPAFRSAKSTGLPRGIAASMEVRKRSSLSALLANYGFFHGSRPAEFSNQGGYPRTSLHAWEESLIAFHSPLLIQIGSSFAIH